MAYYVCKQLDVNQAVCNEWVEVQEPIHSKLESLAITKQQAFELSSAIAVIFIICYCYKILERNFLN